MKAATQPLFSWAVSSALSVRFAQSPLICLVAPPSVCCAPRPLASPQVAPRSVGFNPRCTSRRNVRVWGEPLGPDVTFSWETCGRLGISERHAAHSPAPQGLSWHSEWSRARDLTLSFFLTCMKFYLSKSFRIAQCLGEGQKAALTQSDMGWGQVRLCPPVFIFNFSLVALSIQWRICQTWGWS